MADNLPKRPGKGILKNSSSFDKQDAHPNAKKAKETKWDEMNIIATLHPPDKDYGHMKIDEPKTPYAFDIEDVDLSTVDANHLAERIRQASERPPKVMQESLEEEDEDEDVDLTDEEKNRRKEFRSLRKKHYNEFFAVQLARKLLEEEDEDDDEDGTKEVSKIPLSSPKSPSPTNVGKCPGLNRNKSASSKSKDT